MDLRESFGVLRRHRILTSVLLLLTLAGTMGATIKLPWTYKASSTVALLNSRASSKVIGGGNPYLSFNSMLVQMANFLVIQLMASNTALSLQAQGYTASYQAQVLSENPENEEPFIQISVSGSNKDMVEQTLNGLNASLNSLLTNLQNEVSPQDRATLQVIAEDSQPSRSISAKIKPLVGILGIGLVLTFIIPQAVDGAAARRRARKHRGTKSELEDQQQEAPPGSDDSDQYLQVTATRSETFQPRWMDRQSDDEFPTYHVPPSPQTERGANRSGYGMFGLDRDSYSETDHRR